MDFSILPKCNAKPKLKSTRTHPCRHIALENGRCYYHGGKNKTKHGLFTKTAKIERTNRRFMIDETRRLLKDLGDFINEKK